jgi:hypothetical protein
MKTAGGIRARRTGRARCRGGTLATVLVVVLFVIAAGVILWALRSGDGPAVAQHTRADLQARIGVEVARVVRDVAATTQGPVVVFILTGRKSGPYANQLAALQAALAWDGIEIEVYDPRSSGLRNDAPYTHGYELILERTRPGVLVALIHGGIDIGPIPSALRAFVDEGGRLVLLGGLSKAEGPFVDWIRQGEAFLVARRTGVLQHLAPDARLLNPATTPQEYFEQYYTVLTAENIDEKLTARQQADVVSPAGK